MIAPPLIGTLLALGGPVAQAADWRLVDQTGDCKVYVDESQDVYHGKAQCLWTDVATATVIGALEDPTSAPTFFSNVKVSRVLSRSGDTLQVFQVHKFPVGSDRESYKNLRNVTLPDGFRIEWTLFSDCPEPTDGRVTLEADSGHWQVRTIPAGTEVEFFMAYAPGGFLGVFPADKFMREGMVKTLGELRTEATRRADAGPR